MTVAPKNARRATAGWRATTTICLIALLAGCSTTRLVVRTTQPLLEKSVEAMNRETDLELARAAIPANLKMLDGMIAADPGNAALHLMMAEGLYGYAFAFVEPTDRARASALYLRCHEHASRALLALGLKADPRKADRTTLERAVAQAGERQLPGLFWAAACLAKHVDMNRDDPRALSRMARAVIMMQRVLALDPGYYHAGPHLFFAVYYGSRPPMLGGDLTRSARHFDKARELTDGRLLMVDVLQAEFLDRQNNDREAFHRHLMHVLRTPVGTWPELAFANQVARQRARDLLLKESAWFD